MGCLSAICVFDNANPISDWHDIAFGYANFYRYPDTRSLCYADPDSNPKSSCRYRRSTVTSRSLLVPGAAFTTVPRPLPTPTVTSTPIYPPAVAGGATMRDSVIEDNDAPNGGGVYNRGQLALYNVLLRHNRAVDTAELLCCSDGGGLEPSGGGIYSEGLLTLSDSQVISNTASALYGGGIRQQRFRGRLHSFQGLLILEGSTVSGNMSHGRGGGIANGTLDYVV